MACDLLDGVSVKIPCKMLTFCVVFPVTFVVYFEYTQFHATGSLPQRLGDFSCKPQSFLALGNVDLER